MRAASFPHLPVRAVLALLLLTLLPVGRATGGADAQPWDVLVVGGEPEGVAAAVAAAEAGARTALVSSDPRLGGLFVLGGLNVLDVRTRPPLQRGLFERWWRRVGGGYAFDTGRAEAAFAKLLDEAGVRVELNVRDPRPIVASGRVVGVRLGDGRELRARSVVDADPDGALAHRAGAEFSFGWRSVGLDARMADTMVIEIGGVDWEALRAEARVRGAAWASVDEDVAWGAFGGVPAAYEPTDSDLRLRGLNLGRQDDGSVLMNALLIFGVDPFDASARDEARARAAREARFVIDWLRDRLPGFAEARFEGTAERLYVRETRHLRAECVLDADHLLDHETGPFDVAAGGYPLDVQSLTRQDTGYVFGTPEVYGVPLCVTVPQGVDGLWLVGRSAGYTPVAHGSTRVVPLGMAVAEGVGLAAAGAAASGRSPREIATSRADLERIRAELRARGAHLPPQTPPEPVGPHDHPHHGAYRALLEYGLALGGYANEPNLDAAVPMRSLVYLLAEVAKRVHDDGEAAKALVASYAGWEGPLDAERARRVVRAAACRLGRCPAGEDHAALVDADLWPQVVPRSGDLTRGESYALGAAAMALREGDAAAAPR